MFKKIVVLGAGLSGLSTAYKLSNNGFDVTLIEKDEQVGGLAKTFHKQNYSYDLGPHRFVTTNENILQEVKSLIGESCLQLKQRKTKIYMKGACLEYPPNVKDILSKFDIATSLKIMVDYLTVPIKNKMAPRSDGSFESWVLSRFGETLYNLYFRDYTAKLWRMPATAISQDWASQRISVANLGDIVKRLFLKGRQTPRTYLNSFYYPTGGIGTIATRMAEIITRKGGKIYFNSPVKKLNIAQQNVESVTFCENKKTDVHLEADYVVSTIPLSELTLMITDDNHICKAALNLKWICLIFTYFLIERRRISDNHWFYFPEKEYIFNRVSEMKNFSSEMVLPDETLICVETTCTKDGDIWNSDPNSFLDELKNALFRTALVEPKEIKEVFIHKQEYAYPVYDLQYKDNLKRVLHYVDGVRNLISIGRQGMFRYNNMDHSIEMGFKASEYLLGRCAKEEIFKVGSSNQYFEQS